MSIEHTVLVILMNLITYIIASIYWLRDDIRIIKSENERLKSRLERLNEWTLK